MKPSLMLGTSTGQELLFVRIMSKSHTSAWKTNVHTHRLVSTSIGLTQLRISHFYLTYQPNGNYVTQIFLSPPALAIRCFPGTQLYVSTAGQSHRCCSPAPPMATGKAWINERCLWPSTLLLVVLTIWWWAKVLTSFSLEPLRKISTTSPQVRGILNLITEGSLAWTKQKPWHL